MKIVIAGVGKAGLAAAGYLSREEKHNIVLLDRDPAALKRATELLKLPGVAGNGESVTALAQAGAEDADLVIAAMKEDKANMLCCMTARSLGAAHTAARVREPDYYFEVSVRKRNMGVDLILNPEREAALEVARLLRLPAALHAQNFSDGRQELMAFRIGRQDHVLIGKPLSAAMAVIGVPVLFCVVVRNGESYIPKGDFVLQEGDLAYLVGKPEHITRFLQYIGKYTGMVDDCMVIGGGKIAYYLGRALEGTGLHMSIIETDEARCRQLRTLLPEATVIQGDGTNDRLLMEKNIKAMGAVVSLTDRDEENMLVAMHAGRLGVSRIIAKVNRNHYQEISKDMGIERIVVPKTLMADQLVQYVRGLEHSQENGLEALYRLADGQAEALEFAVGSHTAHLGEPFHSVKFREGFLVASIVRGQEMILPSGNDYLQAGDSVVLISNGQRISELDEVFA